MMGYLAKSNARLDEGCQACSLNSWDNTYSIPLKDVGTLELLPLAMDTHHVLAAVPLVALV